MFELALRTTAILAVAWLVTRILGRASAATRHLVWHSAILAVIAAPIVAPIAPRVELPAAPVIVRAAQVPSVVHSVRDSATDARAVGPEQVRASSTALVSMPGAVWWMVTLAWLTGSAILLLRLLIGVLAGVVRQRTSEIGVRMAFGAPNTSIFRQFIGLGLKLSVIGVAIGLVAAVGLTRWMASMLVGVTLFAQDAPPQPPRKGEKPPAEFQALMKSNTAIVAVDGRGGTIAGSVAEALPAPTPGDCVEPRSDV